MVAMSGRRHFATSHRRQAKHQFRLLYYANKRGVGKRTEFSADSVTAALEFALSDPSRRSVDIWEDGEFACRLQRDILHHDVHH